MANCHRDEVVPYILRYLEKQGPILEAGCGLGRFVVFMEQQGFRDVRGIDISPDAVGIVNRIAPDLNVTCGDVSDLPFEDSSIRGIVSLGVVEHFEQGPRAALQEFQRVMMPGATALITVPFLNLVRRFKHAARIYEIGERVKAIRGSDSAIESREDVVGRSIAHLSQENSSLQHKPPSQFIRWPPTGTVLRVPVRHQDVRERVAGRPTKNPGSGPDRCNKWNFLRVRSGARQEFRPRPQGRYPAWQRLQMDPRSRSSSSRTHAPLRRAKGRSALSNRCFSGGCTPQQGEDLRLSCSA